jgi:hypothetical protein
MRIMFVYWHVENAGSAQTIFKLAEAARSVGHQVVLYAPETPTSRFHCTLDVKSADAVIFVLEWNIYLHDNKPLDLEGPVSLTPRERRIIIDNDGMYNDPVHVGGDFNHPTNEDSRFRTELYDWISDKIYQPTLHPLRSNVGTYLFHGYSPAWQQSLNFDGKEYGMVYVGSNWFRWRAMKRVLKAIEPIRQRVGPIAIVGHDWVSPPVGAEPPLRDIAYETEPEYLSELDVELLPPVSIEQVIPSMSRGVFTPVLVRPVFNHLRLANPRLFETPAANTIPLFALDPEYVYEIYGEAAAELVLGEDATEHIDRVLMCPEHYAPVVTSIRRHIVEKHSFQVRLKELIDIIES